MPHGPYGNKEKVMSRVQKRVIGALALVVMAFGIVSPSAEAGSLYLYAKENYSGQLGKFWTKMSSWRNMSPVADDNLESYKNGTLYSVCFAHNPDGQGHTFPANPGENAPSFYWWDQNKASSFFLGKSC